ncbi:MAG TPA: kelch repeat-containing protein [Nitrolancea sp.]|nr:kelch repeat-containing protein [Nitrolancea sp.]
MRQLLRRIAAVLVALSVVAALSTSDPVAGAASGWLLTGPIPIRNDGPITLIRLQDGRALAEAFDAGSGERTAQAALYDLTANSWSLTSPVTLSNGDGAPVVLADGRVLFTGGAIGVANAPSTTTSMVASQIYDPVTSQWTTVAPMLKAHAEHTATLLDDGTVLVVGGISNDTAYGPTTDAERYDPRTNTWTTVGSEADPRISQAVVRLHDGRVLVVGGLNEDEELVATAELFDPATNRWVSSGSMTTPRDGASATVLPDGTVLVAGGTDDANTRAPLSSTEIYDPATGQWSDGPSMTVAREQQAAILLSSGSVLVAGGVGPERPDNGDLALASSEIYDPVAGIWTVAPSLPMDVGLPAAIMLKNGVVLVAGPGGAVGAAIRGALYFSQLPSPTEPQLPPADPLLSSRVYFPQTSHYLQGGFLAYWQDFGGLAVFGYPISEEFQQNGVTVQYFERARFEWHPGAWPSHFDVELSLLGTQAAQQQGLTATLPFQPVDATSDANCTDYPQTGHRLCFGFRSYWESHGGLAIFGYPISEEFRDPATGLTVQYFERAVFEYHPNNAAPYQVLLRRLGAAVVGTTNP